MGHLWWTMQFLQSSLGLADVSISEAIFWIDLAVPGRFLHSLALVFSGSAAFPHSQHRDFGGMGLRRFGPIQLGPLVVQPIGLGAPE
jgi:hypothetical protein